MTNDGHRPGGEKFTYYFGSEEEAFAFALDIQNLPDVTGAGVTSANNRSVVQAPDGTLVVKEGLSIQAAIDAADVGEDISIHAGEYEENLVIATNDLNIVAADGVVLKGTFKSDNGIADGQVDEWMQTRLQSEGYLTNSGSGIKVGASGVSIKNLAIDGFFKGVELVAGNADTVITDVDMNDVHFGYFKEAPVTVDGLDIVGGSVENANEGLDFAKSPDAGVGGVNNVLIDGLHLENINSKGLYFEALSNSELTGLTMENVGAYGRVPTWGGNGTFGSGIEINGKYDDFSNILISQFDLTNVGTSNQNGAGSAHSGGGAIQIKARDDAPSYGSNPSTLDNVTIENGIIDGTSTGVRVGEPGKNNAGPTNVTVSSVEITGALTTSFDNASQATVEFPEFRHLGSGDDIDTGPFGRYVDGGVGMDTVSYSIDLDASDFAFDTVANAWTVTKDEEFVILTNVEKVVANGKTFFLLVNGASIQDAVNAASAGDTLLLGGGSYAGFTLDKDLSVVGLAGATIQGNLMAANGLTSAADLLVFLRDGEAYAGSAVATGITINASGATVSDLAINGFTTGVRFGSASDVTLSNLTISETINGIVKGSAAVVDGLTVTGGSISESYIGIYISGETVGQGAFTNGLIDGVTFTHLGEKGIYAEQMSNTTLTGLVMTDVGEYGRMGSFGVEAQEGEFGAGIDINLKYATTKTSPSRSSPSTTSAPAPASTASPWISAPRSWSRRAMMRPPTASTTRPWTG